MFQLLYGDEVYVIDKKITAYKESVEIPSMNLLVSEQLGAEEWDFIMQYPFAEQKRVVIVKMDDIPKQGFDMESIPDYTDVIVYCRNVDTRLKVFKEALKNGCTLECCKLNQKQMKVFIKRIIGDIPMDEAAYNSFMKRTGYFTGTNCDLYQVENYLKHMVCLTPERIDIALVEAIVPESLTEKMFALSDYIAIKDGKGLFSLADKLLANKECPLAMLGCLLRNYRIAYKASIYPGKRADAFKELGVSAFFQKQIVNCIPQSEKGLLLINEAMEACKHGGGNNQVIFKETLAKLLVL